MKRKREAANFESAVLLSSSSPSVESDEGSGSGSTDEFLAVVDHNKPSTSSGITSKKKKFLDNNLLASLDVSKVSDRSASLIMIPTVSNLGQNPQDYNISYSSIRRARQKFRKEIAENLKAELKRDVPLTIHWDGKLIQDITGDEIVDRLPILVSGNGVDQLLGVPKLASGTGENMATAVYKMILEWNISSQIKCMCFDTTASNTGRKNGSCVLLEQKLGNDLLWLPCRHHILEIILESVVSISLPASSGPDIQLFKRFKANWQKLNKNSFHTAENDATIATKIAKIKDDTINFAKTQLDKHQPRHDYRELLELTIIFVGGSPQADIKFKKPGAYHRARWMSKVIYSMKIWMFKQQFKLTISEERGLRDICCFAVEIYVKFWFMAPSPNLAPRLDLQLLKSLVKYKENHEIIASTALKKFSNQLWYLSEKLIALAFFDENVSIETKNLMREALSKPSEESNCRRTIVSPEVIELRHLEDFVTSHTRKFFDILALPSSFLETSAENWNLNEDFKKARIVVSNMKVVNDLAERGVRLMDEYNKLHTNNEEQKQYLLQVVKKYRSALPDKNKKTIMTLK